MTDPYRKPGEPARVPAHLRGWHTKSGDVIKGPFDLETVRRSFRDGYIKSNTLVRAEGEVEWRPLAEVRDITLGVPQPESGRGARAPEADLPPTVAPPRRTFRTLQVLMVVPFIMSAAGLVVMFVMASRAERPAAEPVGSAMFSPELTTHKDPLVALPKSFLGFRFGDTYAQASDACRKSGHAMGPLERDGQYASAWCGGVPVPEPGMDGQSVYVTFCPLHGAPGERACEISLHINERPATGYRTALETLTAKYGKPSEMVAKPPADEEAAARTCAGDGLIASATWRWSDGMDGSLDVALHCLDRQPWAWVTAMDPDGTARYRDQPDGG